MKDVKTEHLSAFQETWQSRLRKNRETCEFIRQPKSQLGKQKNQGILENVLPPCAGTSTPAAAADSPSDRCPRWYRRRHRFIPWALNIRWRCTVVRFPPVLPRTQLDRLSKIVAEARNLRTA
jgi:hypothetical protein